MMSTLPLPMKFPTPTLTDPAVVGYATGGWNVPSPLPRSTEQESLPPTTISCCLRPRLLECAVSIAQQYRHGIVTPTDNEVEYSILAQARGCDGKDDVYLVSRSLTECTVAVA